MTADFDVIVVGAGHAGCEAAAASARLGRRTACVTFKLSHVGRLSCNPAMGGLGKGHLVREIDALGGLIGRVTDAASIQFRRLNTRKGLAVQASRAQVDVDRYPSTMRTTLEQIDGLTLIEAETAGILTSAGRVAGVRLADGSVIRAPSVVLTTGTFLTGVLHRGSERVEGGRIGDPSAQRLSGSLRELGLRLGRLKTGTVPRLDGRTIHWDLAPPQVDTVPEGRFSFGAPMPKLPQVTCCQVYTTPRTHEIIRENLHDSPLYTGAIVGRGPRYCPSIEDKVVRFADRERHLLFLEPEGLDTPRVYVNGLSTSLPIAAQAKILESIPALADAVVLQWGYAVEYDFSDPTDLGLDLQHQAIPGLYLAGQINGTSGYEEAAAQGFVAGVSAAKGEVFHVKRDEGYLGVLIDDLVTRGIGGEPYRMFTSRAEHRLLLREDNADRRLMARGRALGLIDDWTWAAFEQRETEVDRLHHLLATTRIAPEQAGAAGLDTRRALSGAELLRRPDTNFPLVARILGVEGVNPVVGEQVEIDLKYAGYINLAARRRELARGMERAALPTVDWQSVRSLSSEVRERLSKSCPATLGDLARTPGVTAAAVEAVVDLLART